MLRIDDRPVNEWNIYQAGKKSNPLLLELGSRHLLVDEQRRQVFELASSKIVRKGADLYWALEDRPEKPLETSDWLVRDVGLAYRIKVRLVAEGRVLDLQIPHPLDLRFIH